MTSFARRKLTKSDLFTGLVVAAVMSGALLLGAKASTLLLAAVVSGIGIFVLLLEPALGLIVLVAAALLAKIAIPTGTEVVLNPATLMIPALTVIVLVSYLTRPSRDLVWPRVMLPMGLFLIAGLISLVVGTATWDPFVPRGGNFLLVQLAQLALYLFAFLAFWLTANLGRNGRWLKWMTAALLVIGGSLVIAAVVPATRSVARDLATVALIRAPFWVLMAGMSGGQLLFNHRLTTNKRLFLGAILLSTIIYVFFVDRDSASNWVGVGVVLAILAWFRFQRLRWLALALVLLLLLSGFIFPTIWNFAGGDEEWTGSGESRLVLIERVVSVSLRNPATGLGPVAYRNYAGTAPLAYGRAYWLQPEINSHNNYVDIFAQFGLVGIGLFIWLAVEFSALGSRLLGRYPGNFEAGYVRGMLAAGAGALAIMMLADWILPFVYNIGFNGFQASLLFWLFLGGVAALDYAGAAEPSSDDGPGDP